MVKNYDVQFLFTTELSLNNENNGNIDFYIMSENILNLKTLQMKQKILFKNNLDDILQLTE